MTNLPTKESLTVEFKSDRKKLSDTEIVEAIVCLANTDGGTLFLGIEDDGSQTGVHADHRDTNRLAALIAHRTLPPLGVRCELVRSGSVDVMRIEVPQAQKIASTSDGRTLRRRINTNGQPGCFPFPAHEWDSRIADLGLLDVTARPLSGLDASALLSVERDRLRQAIRTHKGDATLLSLSDADLDAALGLLTIHDGRTVPTVAGLLLIGRDDILQAVLPTHEVGFQVLRGTRVLVNEHMRVPLVRAFEQVETLFRAHVIEQELSVGLFRVPVPNIDREAFREALVNAMTHRDYTRLGTTLVQWKDDTLTVSNPGGLIAGVTVDNLLKAPPRSRNPRLADAFKRIGLAEKTGRGVDRIYQGVLRYGRPAPDYSASNAEMVVVELSSAEANLPFLALVLEQERNLGGPLPIDTLMVLSVLKAIRRADITEIADATKITDQLRLRSLLEQLVEAGLVQAHGVKKGRTYTLSAALYRSMGQKAQHVRQSAFDAEQQRQMVLRYVREHGSIRRGEVADLCSIGSDQAKRLLQSLVAEGLIETRGSGRGAHYVKSD